MAQGPGKYDEETTALQEKYQAGGVLLIVLGGTKGHGFSVTATESLTEVLPSMLRNVAQQIEADMILAAHDASHG